VHEYDTILKTLLQGSANSILEQITGAKIARWLNVELPAVNAPRVDLLGVSLEGELIAIELQSTNDPLMPLRMAEYSLRVYRLFQRFPRQILLYVGDGKMRMPAELAGPDHVCRYTIFDIRDLDSETLLSSPLTADVVIAVLTRLRDRKAAVRRILSRIAQLTGEERSTAFAQLLILSGLRGLEVAITEEAQHMPVLNNILDHQVIGPAIKQGRQEGLQEGLQQGRQEGRQEGLQQGQQQGALAVLRKQIEKRFGSLPASMEEHLAALTEPELETVSIRVLDAKSIDDLFER
jgi:predicted transposase YdaD